MSGGMNQRVMIAMAIACNPKLLIADEPTTALDVTIQAQILDLLRRLQRERGMALVLITHNMGVVAEMAQRVAVMYAGQVVEDRNARDLFATPQHPYTAALLSALPEQHADVGERLATIPGMVPGLYDRPRGCLFSPRCTSATMHCHKVQPPLDPIDARPGALFLSARPGRPRRRDDARRPCRRPGRAPRRSGAEPMSANQAPVVEARDLKQTYTVRRGMLQKPALLQAVGGISFSLQAGRTLAVVGESGCGKSTLARVIALIERPTAGELRLGGTDAITANKETRAALRHTVQLVFQNPYGSLNPRKTIGSILEEPLAINTALGADERRARVAEMMRRVGLRPEHVGRYPHMFSGGQRQRIAIARALMLRPALVVADEPVSALDVSIQAQVLNLLADLQREFGVAYLFISHDLAVVRHIAEDVLVMYLGLAMEQGPKARIFDTPLHPYTQALLACTPGLGAAERRTVLKGELPSPLAPPPGCVFSTRCPHATDRCRTERPELRPLDGRQVACHYAESFVGTAAAAPGPEFFKSRPMARSKEVGA